MQINSEYKKQALFYARQLGDARFVGQLLFVVLVLMISWSGIKTIQTNYDLQKQITALDHANTLQKLQNDNLALQNQYFKSNQYLELSARQNFGLAAPGEKEVSVPASVALAYIVDLPTSGKRTEAKAKQSASQRNFESWVDFFLHRQNN
ncbi:MAG: septum formation initiator family protein [Patescibacteria group bacterium]